MYECIFVKSLSLTKKKKKRPIKSLTGICKTTRAAGFKLFSCIAILSIWKKTKHNSERDLWFCLCFLHLLSGFGQVVKKCKESRGWNNLYLNVIVSFKRHCSFFIHCLSISGWTVFLFNWTWWKSRQISHLEASIYTMIFFLLYISHIQIIDFKNAKSMKCLS